MGGSISIGEGPEYRPFHDLRSVPEAGRPREHVKKSWSTGPSPRYSRAECWDFFTFLK